MKIPKYTMYIIYYSTNTAQCLLNTIGSISQRKLLTIQWPVKEENELKIGKEILKINFLHQNVLDLNLFFD